MIELHAPSESSLATWSDDRILTLAGLVPDWQYDAACKGQPEELFYPPAGAPTSEGTREKFCRNCPVKTECLEHALAVHTQSMDYGIWGDSTPNMRRKIRHARALGLPDPDFSKVTTKSEAKLASKRIRGQRLREQGYCCDCAQAHHKRCRQGDCACTRCLTRKELVAV